MAVWLVAFFVLLPLCLWSALVAGLLLRAWRRKHLLRSVFRLSFVHALLLLAAFLLLVQWSPRVSTSPMSTADKIALRDAVSGPAASPVYRMSLEPDLMAKGLRTASELVGLELHSQFDLSGNGQASMDSSLALPFGGFLNVSASGTAEVDTGDPALELESVKIGRVPLPRFLSAPIGHAFVWTMKNIPATAKVLASTEQAKILDGRLELTVKKYTSLTSAVASQFHSESTQETNRVAWLAVERWLAEPPPKGDEGLVATMKFLFRATQELAPDWPAVRQNEAALTAGAMALGHPKFAAVSGITIDRGTYYLLGSQGAAATAHGRRDLVQHFWVSAGLSRIASTSFSSLAGLTKEEMDSGSGGSGFSFPDLLADRAGVRFYKKSVASPADAVAVQRSIAGKWTVEDLIPSIAGLPEGMSEQELAKDYGGVNGARFREFSDEIDRRLGRSPILK